MRTWRWRGAAGRSPRAGLTRLAPLSLLLLGACGLTSPAPGPAVTVDIATGQFSRLDVADAFHVVVLPAIEEALTIEVGERIRDQVIAEVRGDTLYLGLRRRTARTGRLRATVNAVRSTGSWRRVPRR